MLKVKLRANTRCDWPIWGLASASLGSKLARPRLLITRDQPLHTASRDKRPHSAYANPPLQDAEPLNSIPFPFVDFTNHVNDLSVGSPRGHGLAIINTRSPTSVTSFQLSEPRSTGYSRAELHGCRWWAAFDAWICHRSCEAQQTEDWRGNNNQKGSKGQDGGEENDSPEDG
jgi:hypothetical protein